MSDTHNYPQRLSEAYSQPTSVYLPGSPETLGFHVLYDGASAQWLAVNVNDLSVEPADALILVTGCVNQLEASQSAYLLAYAHEANVLLFDRNVIDNGLPEGSKVLWDSTWGNVNGGPA